MSKNLDTIIRPKNSPIRVGNCANVQGSEDQLISLNNQFNKLLNAYNSSGGQSTKAASDLQNLGQKIQQTLDCMHGYDREEAAQIKYKKAMIGQFLKNIRDERIGFNHNRRQLEKQRAMSGEDHRAYVSSNYHMMAWGLVAAVVGGIFIKQM